MRQMRTLTAEHLERIDRLDCGETVVFHDIGWDDYEHLVDEVLDGRHLRVSYDEGTLEVVSPRTEHELYGRFIDLLVRALAETRGLDVQSAGSTTWKRRKLAKGAESDSCYYVGSARRVIGKMRLDLEIDPPPDIVVEIEISRRSRNKFRIYAGLGVPEIWTYDGTAMHFYALSGGEYQSVPESPSFAGVSPSMLADALEHSKREGQTAALRRFRELQR
jgi:Uma2 family endonuclease